MPSIRSLLISFCALIIVYRGVGSYPHAVGGGGKSVSMCTESIKQKENVPNINWPTSLILGGGNTHSAPNCFIGGHAPAPPPFFLRHWCTVFAAIYYTATIDGLNVMKA